MEVGCFVGEESFVDALKGLRLCCFWVFGSWVHNQYNFCGSDYASKPLTRLKKLRVCVGE